jgi:hypothetical protein
MMSDSGAENIGGFASGSIRFCPGSAAAAWRERLVSPADPPPPARTRFATLRFDRSRFAIVVFSLVRLVGHVGRVNGGMRQPRCTTMVGRYLREHYVEWVSYRINTVLVQ